MFRQGRIDDNKLRQFTQVSFEIFGESAAAIDAELIIIGYFLLKNLGLEAEVVLNSVGERFSRANEWHLYLKRVWSR